MTQASCDVRSSAFCPTSAVARIHAHTGSDRSECSGCSGCHRPAPAHTDPSASISPFAQLRRPARSSWLVAQSDWRQPVLKSCRLDWDRNGSNGNDPQHMLMKSLTDLTLLLIRLMMSFTIVLIIVHPYLLVLKISKSLIVMLLSGWWCLWSYWNIKRHWRWIWLYCSISTSFFLWLW